MSLGLGLGDLFSKSVNITDHNENEVGRLVVLDSDELLGKRRVYTLLVWTIGPPFFRLQTDDRQEFPVEECFSVCILLEAYREQIELQEHALRILW